MLDNNKCILVYGLSSLEILRLRNLGYKLIEITPEMCEMILIDIIIGLKFEIFNNCPVEEKIILYNNLSQEEVKKAMVDTRKNIKDGILAVVTQQFVNWKISYLIKYLINEKEWNLKFGKEKSNE